MIRVRPPGRPFQADCHRGNAAHGTIGRTHLVPRRRRWNAVVMRGHQDSRCCRDDQAGEAMTVILQLTYQCNMDQTDSSFEPIDVVSANDWRGHLHARLAASPDDTVAARPSLHGRDVAGDVPFHGEQETAAIVRSATITELGVDTQSNPVSHRRGYASPLKFVQPLRVSFSRQPMITGPNSSNALAKTEWS